VLRRDLAAGPAIVVARRVVSDLAPYIHLPSL
jgi:hypothetical protein